MTPFSLSLQEVVFKQELQAQCPQFSVPTAACPPQGPSHGAAPPIRLPAGQASSPPVHTCCSGPAVPPQLPATKTSNTDQL